jgi:phosphoserine phosphatase
VQGSDALPSWQHGENRDAILSFLARVTDPTHADFVPVEQRIAVFDHDGTLWLEKPEVTELVFIKDLFRHHAQESAPDASQTSGQRAGRWLLRLWRKIRFAIAWLLQNILRDGRWLLREYLAGVSTDEYQQWARQWLASAKHPRFNRLYTELTYQPMQEVLQLFAAHQFKNYIVSGGSNYFVRALCQPCYRITPPYAIGSQLRTKVRERHGVLQVELQPIPWFFDNHNGKVLAIENRIDLRPIAAFGNTSGDVAMLRWTGQQPVHLCMLVHHTDAAREYCYSPGQPTLNAAKQYGWQVIDMKQDWRVIFRFDHPTDKP